MYWDREPSLEFSGGISLLNDSCVQLLVYNTLLYTYTLYNVTKNQLFFPLPYMPLHRKDSVNGFTTKFLAKRTSHCYNMNDSMDIFALHSW